MYFHFVFLVITLTKRNGSNMLQEKSLLRSLWLQKKILLKILKNVASPKKMRHQFMIGLSPWECQQVLVFAGRINIGQINLKFYVNFVPLHFLIIMMIFY